MADSDRCSENVTTSDSAYSNSYNTTRSHNSTAGVRRRSECRSSGSSGYGGNPSSGSSGASVSHKEKKDGDPKNDIPTSELEVTVEDRQEQKSSDPIISNITPVPVSDDKLTCEDQTSNIKEDDAKSYLPQCNEEHSCVVAMQTGIIVYSTMTLCNTLGYPQEMWVGRSFIDFINPRDRVMFASHVSSIVKASMSMSEELQTQTRVSIHCRLRQYNRLASSGFGIKTRSVAYLPFKMTLSFYGGKKKNETDTPREKILGIGNDKEVYENLKGAYIVAQATSIVTYFKAPLEILAKGVIFTLHHSFLGVIEHIDPISIPYLGYMPHDLVGKCAIKMYHPEDLYFLRRVYETVIREGQAPKASIRIQTQNGDYVRVESEFTCFVNPWSKKMEYVTAHHEVIQGPCEVDVFSSPDPERSLMIIKKVRINAKTMRDQILKTLSAERDFELSGVSLHHDFFDENSASTDTSPSYNQMNYKENLQRFFDSIPVTPTGLSPQHQTPSNDLVNTDRYKN